MGLGSILGTGIFVSIGLAAEVAGPAVVLAVALAAGVATFNGLSSAALAASHPVSGGTYEYGYRYLTPTLGFLAGWMFLCAKTASAATAALGLAGYVLTAVGVSAGTPARVGLGVMVVGLMTVLVGGGMSQSNRANAAIVSITIAALAVFVVCGLPTAVSHGSVHLQPFFPAGANGVDGLLHATALMFVAYTGYGRIATLGEEVREPERSIPRAIIAALVLAMALYVAVTAVAVGVLGAQALADATRAAGAPLELAARQLRVPALAGLVALGAMSAMTGVLLNLLLGLSRVLLAMGRRGDMPRSLAAIDTRNGSPRHAVAATGGLVAILVLIGNVKLTWSFSAFTVLVYYALTNLAALRLPVAERRTPRVVPVLGLVSCLGLTVWIEPEIWLAGVALIGVGLIWHGAARRLGRTWPTVRAG
jgi:APA family basic amino acid/polyamine antiporter